MAIIPSRTGKALTLSLLLVISLLYQADAQVLDPGGSPPSLTRNSGVDKKITPHNKFILGQIWDDMAYLCGEPDFYAVVGGLSLTPVAFHTAFQNESPEFTELWSKSSLADGIFEGGEIYGNGVFPVAASAASYGLGKIIHSKRLQKFGSDLIQAQAVNGVMTLVMKAGINRTRPDGSPYSYPSGHTSSAFTTAGVVYSDFGPGLGIPAFAAAGYVGLSRLQEGKHYFSDIVAGGILGTYISLKLAHRKKNNGGISAAPLKSDNCSGLAIFYRF